MVLPGFMKTRTPCKVCMIYYKLFIVLRFVRFLTAAYYYFFRKGVTYIKCIHLIS